MWNHYIVATSTLINKPSLLSLHQVYITFKSDDLEDLETARGTLEQCIVDVNNWMLQNNLKLNQDQSELIDIHAKNRLKPSLEWIQVGESTIHLIPKCRPINYSFVYVLISPLCLVSMYKTQKNFDVKMRQKGRINLRTKEYFICLHFGIYKVYCTIRQCEEDLCYFWQYVFSW